MKIALVHTADTSFGNGNDRTVRLLTYAFSLSEYGFNVCFGRLVGGFSIRLRYSAGDRERYYAMLSLLIKAHRRGWKVGAYMCSGISSEAEESRSTDKPRSERKITPAIDFRQRARLINPLESGVRNAPSSWGRSKRAITYRFADLANRRR